MVKEGDVPMSRSVMFASGNFFDVLGISVTMGAGFRPENDQRGAPPVAVLSDRYWRLRLNADPHIVGKTLSVGGTGTTIGGGGPPQLRGLSLTTAPDIYMPLDTLRTLIDPNMKHTKQKSLT